MEIGLSEKLRQLLQTPNPAKGRPFPRIPGPRTGDRVCIIGAGPAGLHMATLLKKLNYANITIFEKTNRVGGMSFDVSFRGWFKVHHHLFKYHT